MSGLSGTIQKLYLAVSDFKKDSEQKLLRG